MHDSARALSEIAQQLEFAMGEVERRVAARCPEMGEIDQHTSQLEPLDGGAGTAQDDADPRQQLLHIEWLRDVVLGAERQSVQLVRLLRTRGEHDHWKAMRRR